MDISQNYFNYWSTSGIILLTQYLVLIIGNSFFTQKFNILFETFSPKLSNALDKLTFNNSLVHDLPPCTPIGFGIGIPGINGILGPILKLPV